MQRLTSHPPRLLYPVIGLATLLLLWLGCRNHPDPIWLRADQLLHQPCPMIEEVVDSLNYLHAELHPELPASQQAAQKSGDSSAYNILCKPYPRTLAWDKFRDFCRQVARQRLVLVSGVTGGGTTKLAEKAARFLATRPDSNVLTIRCAPEFDLEFHKKYIGEEDERGVWHDGELLEFWKQCAARPKERFVCVVDNFDKINPETFFGPELWEKLSTPKEIAELGGRRIEVPTNFCMLSVTHLGPGSRVEFNDEHFKRLGARFVVEPNACELLDYFQREARELAPKAKKDTAAAKSLAALLNTGNQRRMVYYFLKTNDLLVRRYGPGYELGQGSNFRRYYRPEQTDQLKEVYLTHINSLNLSRPLLPSDFDDIDYTVANDGCEPHTNFFARVLQMLRDTGYLVEITTVGATALLTALFGWWFLRRRERLIRQYGAQAQKIFEDFESQTLTGDEAARRLEIIKNEVNDLVLRRRLNYTEGLYFMAFVEDKVRRIEFARNVSENFLELFNAFMEDNILTENEYQKLRQFLQSIWHKIPDETYRDFSDKVERTYAASRGDV